VWGGSYWSASLQYRALRGGARLGRAIGRGLDVVNEYDSQASLILDYMQASPDIRKTVQLTRERPSADILE